jgi:hypothetical protein
MEVKLCRHIKTSGLQCRGAALAGSVFCYFHNRLHRSHDPYRDKLFLQPGHEPGSRYLQLPPLEDRDSIQIAISSVVNALATGCIDERRAYALFNGLYLASANARGLRLVCHPTKGVRDVYKEPWVNIPDANPDIAPPGRTCDIPDPVILSEGEVPVLSPSKETAVVLPDPAPTSPLVILSEGEAVAEGPPEIPPTSTPHPSQPSTDDPQPALSPESEVGAANVGGGVDGVKRDVVIGGNFGEHALDIEAAALFAVDEAEDSGDGHSGVAGGLDGGDSGTARGADVVDDDDRRAGVEEALNAAAGAVSLLGLADQEAVEERGRRAGVFVGKFKLGGEGDNLVVVAESPGRSGGGIGDERVGSHGEASDGEGVGHVLADDVVEDQAGETASLSVERRGATVDVVVGLLATGQSEVSQLEGEGGDEVEECGAGAGGHWVKDKARQGWRLNTDEHRLNRSRGQTSRERDCEGDKGEGLAIHWKDDSDS